MTGATVIQYIVEIDICQYAGTRLRTTRPSSCSLHGRKSVRRAGSSPLYELVAASAHAWRRDAVQHECASRGENPDVHASWINLL